MAQAQCHAIGSFQVRFVQRGFDFAGSHNLAIAHQHDVLEASWYLFEVVGNHNQTRRILVGSQYTQLANQAFTTCKVKARCWFI